jgi:hypothetical protein
VRPRRRFFCARDNVDLCRDILDLRDARTVRLCELAAGDRRDPVLFAVLARDRRPLALRDLGEDFFTGCRLSALFETPVARLTAFRTGRPVSRSFSNKSADHSTNDCASRAGYAADRRTSYGPSCLLRNWRT